MPEQNSTVNYPTIKTISDFKSKLAGGGTRSNLFEVELSFPINAPIPFAQDAVDLGKYMVKAAALPPSQVTALPVAFRGRTLNVAGDRSFQSWTITVINDTDFKIRAAYERWMNYINNVASNRGETNPTNYMADARIFQLDRNGKTLRYYKMYDLFPTQISQIGVDYETDAVQQFTVELQVLYWEAYEGDYLARGPEYDVASDVEAVATGTGPEQ